ELLRRSGEIDTLGAGLGPEQEHLFGKVRAGLQTLAAQRRSAILCAMIEGTLRPTRDLAWFRAEEQSLRADSADAKRLATLLDDWSAVQNGTTDDVQQRS